VNFVIASTARRSAREFRHRERSVAISLFFRHREHGTAICP